MTFEERRAARANIPVVKYRRGEEPPDDWSKFMSAEERFELVHELSGRLFEIAGSKSVHYSRSEIPVSISSLG